ncbi:MAG: tetratricopeptide repeat protein, partial [Leptolyngbyaceae cyanobacterium HOT.MB2.61]|nr:tetratricopeptide repeat protein [Leptolyngbyaceae cyanobacterium HOT.MB2.61]
MSQIVRTENVSGVNSFQQGVELSQAGNYEAALLLFDEAIRLQPNSYDVWNEKGNALINLGRHGEAIACFERAIACDPTIPATYYSLGWAAYVTERYELAIANFQKTLELQSDFPKSYVYLWCMRKGEETAYPAGKGKRPD